MSSAQIGFPFFCCRSECLAGAEGGFLLWEEMGAEVALAFVSLATVLLLDALFIGGCY